MTSPSDNHTKPSAVDSRSPAAEKIALFRTLFRGRAEVYARRFENAKTGRSGYQPACANEWARGICEKPRIKCSECHHQNWLPVTDEVIRWHLQGADSKGKPFVMGVYPMLRDERCAFLAVDFDGPTWTADALAYQESGRGLAVPCLLERSRSGAGGHVWMFFEEPVPAALARKLGSFLLTETMERRPEIGMRSYDRLFPNQDTLPQGGFGNLIALPLQKIPRDAGNSVFVNDDLTPYPDQWAALSSAARIPSEMLEQLVSGAEGRGRITGVRMVAMDEDAAEPWRSKPAKPAIATTDTPASLDIVIADQIYIPKDGVGPSLRNAIIRLAAFQNPEFYKAQAMRLPVYDKPRIISCAEDFPQHTALPRGCLDELLELLASLRVKPVIRDERRAGESIDLAFHGELREEQKVAAQAMLAHDAGVLSATTAFGKTVLAAWLIAQRGVKTLVVVHRQQLLEQWVERLSAFLGLPAKEIGRWGGGRKKLTGRVDVAIIQSLIRKEVVSDLVENYGHLVVDECHHVSARSFELVARRAKAKFVTGLSATVTRKDGHHPVVFMQCGPVRHRVDAKRQAAERPFTHEVWVRPTGFFPQGEPKEDKRAEFQRLCDAVAACNGRNRMICADVAESVRAGRVPVVLTERTAHLETLAGILEEAVPHVIRLRGGMGRKELLAALERLKSLPENEGRVLVATGRFLGEGFDDPRLDTLFLTMPVSWHGTIAQYVGRLHRLHEGKRSARVYDYADMEVLMLARMFERRCLGYEAVGYTILVPASALPGWPMEVPLPADPKWKETYTASVRRLIRDGVDIPLARLFVDAAADFSNTAEGEGRARSASEAFLFRRIDSLTELSGKFRLNARLPIPFDDMGQMEVDFLCAASKLAIELDGGRHLGDADAWRRDRRKDAALQSHGYFVLRFLAADLAARMDFVLDTIRATLATLEQSKAGG